MSKLSIEYYQSTDVVGTAQDLLGKVLCTQFNGVFTAGVISETEAYAGVSDKACHAFGGRRTKRTETMYAQGGLAYVYLCYGIHHLFNVVVSPKENPQAVLVRGIQPLEGIKTMLSRRNKSKVDKTLSAGPGTASQALGIRTSHNSISLLGDQIWIEDRGISVPNEQILIGPRIGVDYAGDDALLPYRFLLREELIGAHAT